MTIIKHYEITYRNGRKVEYSNIKDAPQFDSATMLDRKVIHYNVPPPKLVKEADTAKAYTRQRKDTDS